jgi:hypothetical protein
MLSLKRPKWCKFGSQMQRDLLEQDDFSSNHHPALLLCWSMIFPKTGTHFSGSCSRLEAHIR